jgi:hypothetical protein
MRPPASMASSSAMALASAANKAARRAASGNAGLLDQNGARRRAWRAKATPIASARYAGTNFIATPLMQ